MVQIRPCWLHCLLSIASISLHILHINAATLQDDCQAHNLFGDVEIAVDEAIDMAHYAALRAASTEFRRKGTLLQDLLGAESEDDPDVLQQVIRKSYHIPLYIPSVLFPSYPNLDHPVLISFSHAENFNTIEATARRDDTFIHCSDAHLTRIGSTGTGFTRFRDNTRGGASILTQDGNGLTACGGRLRAFHYFAPGFGNVIILCSDSPKGAIPYALQPGAGGDSRPIIGRWKDADLRAPAAIINPEDNQQRGLDVFGVYLSYMVLHEFMHTSRQCKCT